MNSIYSVSQINSYIKNMFQQDYLLHSVSVRGELSNVKYHSSGHIYFTIKDKGGSLSCVMFQGNRKGLTFSLKEGQQIVCQGQIDTFPRDGVYQLYAKTITLDGAGLLYERYEKLKKDLEEMGMFSKEYKKDLPKYATRIGVVTAKTGAAIQDIINVSKRRNPYVEITLYPAKVQGEGSAETIVNGIRALDRLNLDVIIVGRGGGSIEDLWAFNEEIVARAIFECETPIISAVGHETDTTIADYVADMRAPTPSAAAEIAVFSYDDFLRRLEDIRFNMEKSLLKKIDNKKLILQRYQAQIEKRSPENQLREMRMMHAYSLDRLNDLMIKCINRKRHRYELLIEKMRLSSPLEKLSSGYAYVSDNKGKNIKSVSDVTIGELLTLNMKDGVIETEVKSLHNS